MTFIHQSYDKFDSLDFDRILTQFFELKKKKKKKEKQIQPHQAYKLNLFIPRKRKLQDAKLPKCIPQIRF